MYVLKFKCSLKRFRTYWIVLIVRARMSVSF